MSAALGVHEERETTTGWDNQRLGLMIFITSEALLFASVFAMYFFNRASSTRWPPAGDRVPPFGLALGLTLVLLISGWTCYNAVAAIQRGSQMGMLRWLSLTIVLGVVVISLQAAEYISLFAAGIKPSSGIYATTYYALTGLHDAHVLAGLGLLIAMYLRGLAGHFTSRRHFGLQGATIYWHFIVLVWVVLYLSVYLL